LWFLCHTARSIGGFTHVHPSWFPINNLGSHWSKSLKFYTKTRDPKSLIFDFFFILEVCPCVLKWQHVHPCPKDKLVNFLVYLTGPEKSYCHYFASVIVVCSLYVYFNHFLWNHFWLTLPKAMWGFAITWHQSSVNFSHFNLLLWNPSAKMNWNLVRSFIKTAHFVPIH
jgi:hypothetical protein